MRARRSSPPAAAVQLLLFLLLRESGAENPPNAVAVVHKCCPPGEIAFVNHNPADQDRRLCWHANVTGVDYAPWTPEFSASRETDEAAAHKTLPKASVPYR